MTPAHGNILERVQDDVKTAMKAGEKDKVGQLRMIVNALQQEAKEGKDDEVAALQRERKRRLDAAEALRDGGRDDAAGEEEDEAKRPVLAPSPGEIDRRATMGDAPVDGAPKIQPPSRPARPLAPDEATGAT